MKGLYNGASMKLRHILPVKLNAQLHDLSKNAQIRLQWIDWYYGHNKNARLTCRHFGISPSVFYRWLTRFEKGNKRFITLEDKSRKPHKVRTPTTEKNIIDLVVQTRKKNPAWSKYKIREILSRDFNVSVSSSTVGRILKRKHLINPQYGYRRKSSKVKNHKIPRTRAHKSLKSAYPGSLIQVDTKRVSVLGTTYYQFTAIDCMTRLQYIDVFSTITSSSGRAFLKNAQEYFPFKIDIQSDNGSEFLKEFHEFCEKNDMDHYFIYPNCPKQNGRVERLNQTAQYEFWDYQEDLLPKLSDLKQKAKEWNIKYNTYRPHQALGYKTPYAYYMDWLEKHPAERDESISARIS